MTTKAHAGKKHVNPMNRQSVGDRIISVITYIVYAFFAFVCASESALSLGLQSLPVVTLPVCLLVRKYTSLCSHTFFFMLSMRAIGLISAIF